MKQNSTSNRNYSVLRRIGILFLVIVICLFVFLLLLPVGRPNPVRYAMARTEMKELASAINQYVATYDRLPLPDTNTNGDATFGISPSEIENIREIPGTLLITSNSDVMSILMDMDAGANAGHVRNPQKHSFFDAEMVSNTITGGVSTIDHQFRDPWGNPYIISLDANRDGQVCDACYGGMTNGMPVNVFYEVRGNVMIWSRGPDGKVDMKAGPKTGVNKDNLVGW